MEDVLFLFLLLFFCGVCMYKMLMNWGEEREREMDVMRFRLTVCVVVIVSCMHGSGCMGEGVS